MRAANLALKFLLELAALALLAVAGFRAGDGWTAVALGVLAPLAMVVVWGRYAAPKSPRRAPARWRIPLELGIFVLAGALAYAVGLHVLAVVFVALVVVNAVLLTAFDQWEA